ncbi:MAG: 50S ribosomal protein L14 [Candidatus Aenigmarchaeota archaeon ex4484_224]|nr:MAG: 50S ribosomal protein L14 [Candidatus Aenigmarchaeota archaeon ex4484_224]
MKPVSARVTKALNVGTYIPCVDNTGAKLLQIISVKGYKGVRGRQPKAGVGDLIKVSVKEGDVKLRKQVFTALIIRQKKEYRRKEGIRIKFEDNAAILMTDEGEPKGTSIKGPVAREAVERFSSVGKIASMVI